MVKTTEYACRLLEHIVILENEPVFKLQATSGFLNYTLKFEFDHGPNYMEIFQTYSEIVNWTVDKTPSYIWILN